MAAAQRIDWQAIKARWNTETEVFHLALLPKGSAQLFLAICDRLQWEATYRIEGYDYSDWDELQRIVDLGIAGLTDTMRLSDLIAHIDEVEDLLRQISALSGCCGELSHPFADLLTDPWQDGDPVPENIVDAGFASSTTDQAGYTDYKCLIANVAVQDLVEKINRMAQLIDESNWIVGGVAAIASILTFVVALPAAATVLTAMALGLVAGAGTAAGVWAWLNGVGKATAESTALALDAVYDDLVCAIFQADGPDAATSAVAAVMSDATNAAASLALTPVISMVIHALYAGRYDQTDTAAALANAGFTLAQHNCDCAEEVSDARGVLFEVIENTGGSNCRLGFGDFQSGAYVPIFTTTTHISVAQEETAGTTVVAGSQAALDTIVADVELLRLDTNEDGVILGVSIRNYNVASRSGTWQIDLQEVYNAGAWAPITAITIESAGTMDTVSASGTVLTVAVVNQPNSNTRSCSIRLYL